MTILPGQVLLLPDDLHGLHVLIRVSPQDRTPALAAGIAAVRARGGKPAVLVAAASDADEKGVFALQTRLADLRGEVGASATIALAVPPGLPGGTLNALAPYADVLVTAARRGEGRRVWRPLGAASIDRALAATAAGDAELWTIEMPADAVAAFRLISGVVRAAAPPPDLLVESVDVRAQAPLSAEEIVARHQAAARRQAAALTSVISTGTMTLTFEAPGFAAPVNIASRTVLFQADGRTELEQRNVRVNGIEFTGRGVPRLPIIEPERVSSPPLAIVLGRAYRYSREADQTIRGIRCHVVRFEPLGPGPSFSGRAWISVESYAMVRVAAAQTALRGAIVSSEQVDDFREFAPGVWLLARSEVRQLYEGAAHRTPIHRVLSIEAADLNPSDFAARLQTAYTSPSIMLRDTADGYRYLSRERAPPEAAGGGPPPVTVTEQRADRVRTLIGGVIVDPNISIPLPFAGLNYVDFDLFGTGTQFNGFFGGSYGQLALAVPSIGGTRFQFGARAFAIASTYNDRAFLEGQEIFDENIRQRPAHASAWVLRPLGPRLAVRAGYEMDYTAFTAAPETASGFVVPADQVVHGIRLAVEGQRGGWAMAAWWNGAVRAGWRRWGSGTGDFNPEERDFQRFGATVSRSSSFGPSFVTRLEAAAVGGEDLDRFSRYTFGTFDNRLRGYPAALVRYDRGLVVRGVAAWSPATFVRLDGFLDTAVVRDRGYGTGYRSYTGTGAALEAPLPYGILAAVEWGFGFRGVNGDGSLGTHVIRVSALKVF